MEEFDKLKEIIADTEADLAKAERGNKAAGTRVRKQMQDLKKQAQAVRQAVMDLRAASKPEGGIL